MLRALKFAGVLPTAKDRTWTYAAKTLACQYDLEDSSKSGYRGYTDSGDGLGSATCSVDGKEMGPAASLVLVTGRHEAGIPEPYRMGDKKIAANTVLCIDQQANHTAPSPWSCSFVPVGRESQ